MGFFSDQRAGDGINRNHYIFLQTRLPWKRVGSVYQQEERGVGKGVVLKVRDLVWGVGGWNRT